MSNGTELIKEFLASLEESRTPYSEIDNLYKIKDDMSDGDELAYDAFSRKTLFGFVPVFDEAGMVSLYIRLGGPEIILKARGTDAQLMPEFSIGSASAANLSANLLGSGEKSINAIYGPKADTIHSKYDTILDSDTMIYRSDFGGLERDILQRHVLDLGHSWSARQVETLYPFRLVPVGNVFELQYAKDNSQGYSKIDANALGAFLAELVDSTIHSLVYSTLSEGERKTAVQAVLSVIGYGKKAETQSQSVLEFVFSKMAADFNSAVDTNVKAFYNGSVGTGDSDAYDFIFYAAFAQFLGLTSDSIETSHFAPMLQKAADTAIAIGAIPSSFKMSEVESAAQYLLNFYISDEALNEKSKSDIQKLTSENMTLKTRSDALNSQNAKLVDPKNYRNVGMAAGLLSSLYAVSQKSAEDMDLWKKALIVAGGTGLGALPYVNFLSIASMPYLVNKGIELSGDDEFKASTRARLTQAREGAGRLATSAREGVGRVATSARERLAQARSAGELPESSEA